MKKRLLGILSLFILPILLTGCTGSDVPLSSITITYGVAALLALVLLIGCICIVKKERKWFIVLFSSVTVVNIGYALLSVSKTLEFALFANRIAYLASVFLPLSMFAIILEVTNTKPPKFLKPALVVLAIAVFLIAASPGILDIYYRSVSLSIENGVSTLVKVYGPLHPIYLLYLVGYFAAMVTVIIRASLKKTIRSTSHAVILAIAVFVNIGVWMIEQFTRFDFEFLAVSYIISELFLLGVHLVVSENERLEDLIRQKEEEMLRAINEAEPKKRASTVSPSAISAFLEGLDTLTPTERLIYDAYISQATTKDIMRDLNIKENTLKFHNKNLYSKLGVSSRRQLMEIYKAVNDPSNVVSK